MYHSLSAIGFIANSTAALALCLPNEVHSEFITIMVTITQRAGRNVDCAAGLNVP